MSSRLCSFTPVYNGLPPVGGLTVKCDISTGKYQGFQRQSFATTSFSKHLQSELPKSRAVRVSETKLLCCSAITKNQETRQCCPLKNLYVNVSQGKKNIALYERIGQKAQGDSTAPQSNPASPPCFPAWGIASFMHGLSNLYSWLSPCGDTTLSVSPVSWDGVWLSHTSLFRYDWVDPSEPVRIYFFVYIFISEPMRQYGSGNIC